MRLARLAAVIASEASNSAARRTTLSLDPAGESGSRAKARLPPGTWSCILLEPSEVRCARA